MNKREIVESKYPPINNEDLWLKDGKLYHSTSKGWVPLSEEPSITETYELGVSSISYSGKDGLEHQIELSENVESDVTNIINDTFVTDEDNNVTFTDDNDTEHTLVTTDALPSILANNNMLEVTWQQLKDMRDNSQLIAGCLYRITDYNCTTTQENTQSAGHQFDIVLLALSANKLAEEGWAMMHDNIYDCTFDDGVTAKCWVYRIDDDNCYVTETDTLKSINTGSSPVTINEAEKTATVREDYSDLYYDPNDPAPYNYFQNSNLSAWKVWYCLDNDAARFAWAQDEELLYGVNSVFSNGKPLKRCPTFDNGHDGAKSQGFVYAWGTDSDIADNDPINFIYSKTEHVNNGDELYDGDDREIILSPSSSDVGRGVIYRLIDEWNNDCPYDFKNIQFKRWAITALTSGSDNMKAALIYDANNNPVYFGAKAYDSPVISGATLDDDNYIFAYTFDGALKDAEENITHYDVSAAPFVGPQEFIDYMIEQGMGEGIADVCYDNFIGNYGEMGIEGDNLAPGLTLPNNVFFNSSYCYFDEDEDYWSYAFANCYGNSLKSYCSNNTFGNSCQFNTFGNSCQNNTFGNYCSTNTFGNNCGGNTFGNSCLRNTFGNGCQFNTFGNGCEFNTFGNNCGNNTFGNNCGGNTFGNYCGGNTFGNYCTDSTFGNKFKSNTFGNYCGNNTFGNNAEKCSVGDGVQNITVSKDFMRYVIIENGNQKITITSNKTTSSSAYLQNFLIALGVNNSNSTKTISHNSVNDAFRTIYQNENSTSVNV